MIRNSVADKYKQLYLKNEVINNILSQVKDYKKNITTSSTDVGRILRTFKIKKNVEVTDNGKIII